MLKTKEQLLASFKKANKERKQKILNSAGFDTEEEYVKHLESGIAKDSEVKTKVTIHNAYILDASGSMRGPKFNNAQAAYNAELSELQKDDQNNYMNSLIVFSASPHVTSIFNVPVAKLSPLKTDAYDMTPLYRSICEMFQKLNSFVKPGERVLVNIFTDGSDNKSDHADFEMAKKLIREAKDKDWTVTFVGTREDVNNMVLRFGLDYSNTLTHDNTAAGVQKAMETTRVAKASYFTDVASGVSAQTLSTGFYKKQIK